MMPAEPSDIHPSLPYIDLRIFTLNCPSKITVTDRNARDFKKVRKKGREKKPRPEINIKGVYLGIIEFKLYLTEKPPPMDHSFLSKSMFPKLLLESEPVPSKSIFR
jgi:hypothetical protein